MVKQTVHLKTSSCFGHRTIESQVMHLPVIKSLSGTFCFEAGFCVIFLAATWDTASSSVDSNPAAGTDAPSRFLFAEKSEGNGWLTERPWPGLLLDFDVFEAP